MVFSLQLWEHGFVLPPAESGRPGASTYVTHASVAESVKWARPPRYDRDTDKCGDDVSGYRKHEHSIAIPAGGTEQDPAPPWP